MVGPDIKQVFSSGQTRATMVLLRVEVSKVIGTSCIAVGHSTNKTQHER